MAKVSICMGDIYNSKPDNFIDLMVASVSALATVASAVTMLCTFRHQRKSYAQVQFKTAFYSMQDKHRKLTDSLRLNAVILTEDLFRKPKTYVARQCFLFAYNEVAKIINVVSQEKYLGILKDSDWQGISFWELEQDKYLEGTEEYESCNMKFEKAILEYRRKYCISVYRISEEHYNKVRMLSDKTIFAFRLFLASWLICYEHYIRNLQQLLMYVCNETPDGLSTKEYLNSIAFQMAKEELWFANLYSQIDDTFGRYYTGSGMDKIVNEQLTKSINLIKV